jgi:uncharacterized protein (TIGR02246 family)
MNRIALVFAIGLFALLQAAFTQPQPARFDSEQARLAATQVLDRLDAAWSAGDGAAFAAAFTFDTDVVNIFGARFHGREDLTKRMQSIFGTIFKGSAHRSRTLEIVRYLSTDTILAVSSAHVEVPSGPLAPEIRNRQTFILTQEDGEWRVRHWHNTPIRAVQ